MRRKSKLLWAGAGIGVGAAGTLWVLLRRYFVKPTVKLPVIPPAKPTAKQFAQGVLRAAEDPNIGFVWQDWWRVMEELFPEVNEKLQQVLVFATIKNTLAIKIPRAIQTATTTMQLQKVIEWIDSLPGQWHDWMEALGAVLPENIAATLHLTAEVPLSDIFNTEIDAARKRIEVAEAATAE